MKLLGILNQVLLNSIFTHYNAASNQMRFYRVIPAFLAAGSCVFSSIAVAHSIPVNHDIQDGSLDSSKNSLNPFRDDCSELV